jgi:catechol 2,3-dioxygenase-like lactoylglutathione lyase family enzyme
MSLGSAKVRTSIAVSDISRAAEFYEGKLGLRPGAEQSDESRIYACGGDTSLHVYVSPTGASGATATLATWYVPDLDQCGRRAHLQRRDLRPSQRSGPEDEREGDP